MPIPVDALAVMAKAPVAGQVKTRLLPVLSAEEAAEFYQALLMDQLNHLSKLTDTALYVAFMPAEAQAAIAAITPAAFKLLPQVGTDLGARMQQVFERLRGWGHKNMILIGSDLVPLPLAVIRQAFAALGSLGERVVLGPSHDGGYYLVGMNRLTPQIFAAMSWSHDQVLAQTLTRLADLQIEKLLLPPWFDIDTPEDLSRLQTDLPRKHHATLRQTLTFLRRLGW